MASSPANERIKTTAFQLVFYLLRTVLLILVLHASVFVIFDLLPEATYSRLGAAAIDHRTLEMTRQKLGLSGTVLERYSQSLSKLVHLDFGRSIQTDYPVSKLLVNRLDASALMISLALIFCLALMLVASIWYCTPSTSKLQRVILSLTPVSLMPQFASASIFAVAASFALAEIIGSSITASLIQNFLYVFSIALLPAGVLFMAAARTSQDIVNRSYVQTYLSIGMSWERIRYVLQRNILMELLPLSSLVVVAIVTGTVFAETAFNKLGIGSVLAEAIRAGDQPVAAGWILAIACPVVLISQLTRTLHKHFHAHDTVR